MKKRNVIALAGVALLSAGILAACSGGSKSVSYTHLTTMNRELNKYSPYDVTVNLYRGQEFQFSQESVKDIFTSRALSTSVPTMIREG